MNSIRNAAIIAVLAFILAAPAVPAESKPNIHNTHDCLFCHKETPKFGIDTRETVTFRDATWDDPALCNRCHKAAENLHPLKVKPDADAGTVAPKNLPLGTSPSIEGTVVCVSCHFVHAADSDYALLQGFAGSQKPGLYKDWQDLCKECHTALEKRSPHAGDEKACAFCHQATPKKGQPVSVAPKGVGLCNFCHGGLQNQHFEKANPFKGEVSCLSCHDPHLGPDRPGRLRDAYLAAANGVVTINPHYRKALCFTCHKEEKGYPLLTDDPIALCNRCHGTGEVIGDTHPLKSVPPDIKIPQAWPLKNGAVTCITCHRAGHREDKAAFRFLRGGPYANRNEICFLCHNRETFKKMNPHLDINQMKGCEFCHAVKPVLGQENAQSVKFLADITILCLRCHEDNPHPGGMSHMVSISPERAAGIPKAYPLDRNGKLTCSTCHNPHIEETENYKMRGEATGMNICGECHRF